MINIISRHNNSGLTRDVEIIKPLIPESRFINYDYHSIPPKADINLFVELFDPRYLDSAKLNYIIPNQEWFKDEWKKYIPDFDLIICKSRLAFNAFSYAGGKCVFTSFTSEDKFLPVKKKRKILHSANKSITKGTQQIIQAYQHWPDLPEVTLLSKCFHEQAPNISRVHGFIPSDQFRIMQNTHHIHLCPSISEGFGHYIVEAMSAKCVVITTDGSPMNEIITPDIGFLIPVLESKPFGMGENHFVDEVDLINAVLEAVYCEDLKIKGEASREWYLENDRLFREKFSHLFR